MTITRRELALTSLAALALPATARAAASELRVGFSTDAQTLDPANHRSRSTETIIRQMYDGVLTRSPAMKVDPQLAASWTERNPTTYDFVLQPNVKFHSGATMTAEDVKFTFDRLIEIGGLGDGQTSPRKSLLGPLKEVQIIGPLAVRFVLATPWPILPAMLPFQEVVSKAFVTKVGTNGVATREDGTGPFRLAEWRRGDSLNLERFAQYWGGSPAVGPPGPAKVDRVVIKIIPENAARVAALLAGDVDIIDNLPSFSMHDVAASRTAAVMKVNGTRSFFIALNNAKKPFADVRVRQALNYGLDKRLIIKKILNDTATPLAGVLSPDAFAFDPKLPFYDYDPGKAKALLAEAGYPDGMAATLDTEGAYKDQAEAVAALLQRIGVRLHVQTWEGAVLSAIWHSPAKRRDRDMFFTSWGNGSLDPSDIMVPTLVTGGRGNAAGYSNPKVDQLLNAADIEIDRNRRQEMYLEVQRIVNREAPWIFLWLPQDIYGMNRRIRGWQPQADGRINLHRAWLAA